MPINDMGGMGGAATPAGEGLLAVPEFLDGTKEKRKKNRLVVMAGPAGPQAAMIPTPELYPEEEDPNP